MFGKRKCFVAAVLVCLALLTGALSFRRLYEKVYDKEESPSVDGKLITQEELEFYNGDKERAVRGKVIWNWAEQEGIVDEFSYDAFLEALETENKKRKELHEKGEPVYGPVEFTPMQYYKRLLGECEQALKERKMEELSEEELVAFYEIHQENYRQVDSFTAEYTVWQEGRITYQGILELNDSNMRAMTEADEELANKLLQLEEGGQSTWSDDSGAKKQLICTKREAGGYLSYEEVSGAVLEQCTADEFEKELNEKIEESEVRDFR